MSKNNSELKSEFLSKKTKELMGLIRKASDSKHFSSTLKKQDFSNKDYLRNAGIASCCQNFLPHNSSTGKLNSSDKDIGYFGYIE